MRRRQSAIALAVLFVVSVCIGVINTPANNSLGVSCMLPDGNILWYNGGTGEYASIYQGEAVSDGDSWHNYTVLELTQVGSAGTDDQVNSYNGFYGGTGWLGIADPFPYCLSGSQVVYWNTHLNQTYLDGGYSLTNKQHVACQELGHAFSLAHTSATDSCMTNANLNAPRPNAHDSQMLSCSFPSGGPDTLLANQALLPDQSITSSGGWYRLLYQLDGNLVLYRWDGVPTWASNTAGTSPGQAVMQGDGNFVIYDGGGSPVWDSGTWGNPRSRVVVEFGRVVIYSPTCAELWVRP